MARQPPDPVLESLNRFLSHVVAESWHEFSASWGATSPSPRFSGIVSLDSSELPLFLATPGMLLIFGPLPELRLLDLLDSTQPMEEELWARVRTDPDRGYAWRWGRSPHPPPRYAACVCLEGQWAFGSTLKTRLLRLLQPRGPSLGDTLGTASMP